MSTDHTSYSFEGQDRIAASLLRTVEHGRYIDVGCHHPVINSNSYWFYRSWSRGGVVIDVQETFRDLYEEIRPLDRFFQCAIGTSREPVETFGFADSTLTTTSPAQAALYQSRGRDVTRRDRVESRTLASVIAEAALDTVDVCFVDVEGSELDVLHSLDFRAVRPALFVIEDKLIHPGQASPCAELLLGRDYGLVAKTMLDSFFIDLTSPVFAWLPRAVVQTSQSRV